MKPIQTLLIPLFLTGCISVSSGGSGAMSNGQPIVGKWEHDPQKQEYYVTLISPTGWSCSGEYAGGAIAGNKTITNVPLKCNDGRSGEILLSFGQKLVGAFKLSDGQTGSITFIH